MRTPKRRGEELKRTKQVSDPHLTKEKIERLKHELARLKKIDRPQAIKEMQRLAEMGDFSENVGYSIAKGKVRSLNRRIISLEQRIKQAIPIEKGSEDGLIRLGSTVVVEINGTERIFEILGPQEADPLHGKISQLSPLGSALIGKRVSDSVVIKMEEKEAVYFIKKVY